ncbi:MAG: transposase [Bacteroidales bacterium]|nr:transposase [Bacteroidales bacterium]
MSQSLSKLFVHIVYHVKRGRCTIRQQEKKDLYAYMTKIICDNQSVPIIINGIEDHVHILCMMSKNIALAKLVEEIKRHSSRWIKTKDNYYSAFAWQGGYVAFSVSPSTQKKVKRYIQDQETHHKKISPKEEYIALLKAHGVEYNEDYLWTD